MEIDCTKCEMYRTEHCNDCMVTALLGPPGEVVEVADDLADSLDVLSGAGLIPVLRFRPRETPEPEAEAG